MKTCDDHVEFLEIVFSINSIEINHSCIFNALYVQKYLIFEHFSSVFKNKEGNEITK